MLFLLSAVQLCKVPDRCYEGFFLVCAAGTETKVEPKSGQTEWWLGCSLPALMVYPPLAYDFWFFTGSWLLFDIVLFSALKQTHCARMWLYMSELLFAACFFCFVLSTKVVYLQCWHGWCHKKLLPSQHVLCTPYNHAPCYFMQSHKYVRCMHV